MLWPNGSGRGVAWSDDGGGILGRKTRKLLLKGVWAGSQKNNNNVRQITFYDIFPSAELEWVEEEGGTVVWQTVDVSSYTTRRRTYQLWDYR